MLRTEDWGLIDYAQAVEKQLVAVDEVASGSSEETLLICSHPPLVSTGRGTKPGDVFGWKGALLETTRGGRATYHGPSQIVIYPIINLNVERVGFRARDIHGYMRTLELAMCEALAAFDIQAESGSLREQQGEDDLSTAEENDSEPTPSLTGVWVGARKIASVGIGVRKGVSYHGLALNVENDPQAFQGINPCGFSTDLMTSIEKELGRSVDREKVKQILVEKLMSRLKPGPYREA